uniref:Phosphatidylinositol transfer protein N-terminal domain-containing protein n=1 Tax=Caenorhabditis japonica TaxID=281687 RepID=A0A8R1E7A4_CAEJA
MRSVKSSQTLESRDAERREMANSRARNSATIRISKLQKKSRLDSHGKDSGVEIISNKPYTDGPGKCGQYTFKIYHVGSRIPAWIRTVLPTNALEAHEEAWNAYPVTKTRYSTPMMDRFSLEVETLYYDDYGQQENVFNLSDKERESRQIDYMDFVKDPISSHDYCVEEDPKLYKSEKTGRGPLTDDWVSDHRKRGLPIMCAYKLCRVEFRYWGMQTRAERWIHDLALRNTMLRAHRQAWAWQDEWTGLTMKDIRKLEAEAALHLSKVMAVKEEEEEEDGEEEDTHDENGDATSDDLYFDCSDTPEPTQKPSIIRWSSELELEVQDENSPPLTPHNGAADTALLIMVFHGDFSPDNPADSKTTDTDTFASTIETCVQRHYPQLRNRLHIVNVSCGCEMTQVVTKLTNVSPSFGLLHPSLALMLPFASHLYNEAVEGTIRRANETYNEFIASQPMFNGDVLWSAIVLAGSF